MFTQKESLAEHNSPREIQEGSDCTVHTVITTIENRFNQAKLIDKKLDLDEIKAGHVASIFWGRHKTWIYHHGGNAEIVAKAFEQYNVPEEMENIDIRVINVRQLEKKKSVIIKELREGRSLIYAGLGKCTTKNGESWFVPTEGLTGHAMAMDTIYFNDESDDTNYVVEYQNTYVGHARTKMSGKDFEEQFGHIYTFDLLINGKPMSTEQIQFSDTNNLSQEEKDLIDKYVNHGLIKGFEDGSFRPQDPITRLDFLRILDRAGL